MSFYAISQMKKTGMWPTHLADCAHSKNTNDGFTNVCVESDGVGRTGMISIHSAPPRALFMRHFYPKDTHLAWV